MFLVDSHCHLDGLDYQSLHKNVDDVLAKAAARDVKFCLAVATTLPGYRSMRELVGERDNVVFSCGVHPLNQDEAYDVEDLRRLAAEEGVVAMGETGLDYFYTPETKPRQQESFRNHIRIGRELNKPVIVHTRDARADTLAILRETRATAVVVTHDAEEAMRMADRIALLRDGKLVQVGSSDDLYRRPRDLFTAAFFSEINEFSGIVRNGHVATPLGVAEAPGIAEGREVSIAVRLSGVGVSADSGVIPARILSRRFLGVVELLELAIPGSERPVRSRMRADILPPGLRDATIAVNPHDILVFEKDSETPYIGETEITE